MDEYRKKKKQKKISDLLVDVARDVDADADAVWMRMRCRCGCGCGCNVDTDAVDMDE